MLLKDNSRQFPENPVVSVPHCHCVSTGSIPGGRTKIPEVLTAQHGQKKKVILVSLGECMKHVLSEAKVTQSCLTLCNPMDYTVHGIFQARVLEWGAITFSTLSHPIDYTVCRILQARILEWAAFPFFRGSSHPQRLNSSLPHCRRILYQLSHYGSLRILEWVAYPFSRGSS